MSHTLLVAVLLAASPQKPPPDKPPVRIATVIPLKTVDAAEAASRLLKLLPRSVTVAPVRDENAVIAYATGAEIAEIRRALAACGEEPGKRFTPQFRRAPLADVLAWYAKETGLTDASVAVPKIDVRILPPKGREFTVAEVTDLLNHALARDKLVLIRGEASFRIHPTGDKLDPAVVPAVRLSDLPGRGDTELVRVAFTTVAPGVGDLIPELRKLLGSVGSVWDTPPGTIEILDTAANARRVVGVVREFEGRKPAARSKTVKARFDRVSWSEVLDWYSTETGLTLVTNLKPTGSFTFKPPAGMQFNLAEITDILNEGVSDQAFTILRRGASFTILDTVPDLFPDQQQPDPIPVPNADLADLAGRGRTELVQVLIPLGGADAGRVAAEARKLLTPSGSVSALPRCDLLLVTDTVENVQRVAAWLRPARDALGPGWGATYRCRYHRAEDVARRLRALMGGRALPPWGDDPDEREKGGGPAPTAVSIAVDEGVNTITVAGAPARMARGLALAAEIDSPASLSRETHRFTEMEVRRYSTPEEKAREIAARLQEKFPTLAVDWLRSRKEIVVIATPAEHDLLLRKNKDLTPEEKTEPRKER
jgi:hypothetical protein